MTGRGKARGKPVSTAKLHRLRYSEASRTFLVSAVYGSVMKILDAGRVETSVARSALLLCLEEIGERESGDLPTWVDRPDPEEEDLW